MYGTHLSINLFVSFRLNGTGTGGQLTDSSVLRTSESRNGNIALSGNRQFLPDIPVMPLNLNLIV